MTTAEAPRPAAAASEPASLGRVRLTSAKIRAVHLDKLAIVYVRQSSPQQVLENRESTARQYALADYARLLGWPAQRVLVIDEDQGQSGARADNRTGYQRLLAEVTLDHVGMVLGLEMSRLARSNKDWHHLLELCAIFGVLLADQDGVYDPSDPNDRMLLGLKGTMSEVELHTMRNRLLRGRDHKAQRGEMFHGVPMGYVILPNGEVALDPDEQARSVMRLVFDKFDEIGTIYSLLHYLVRQNVALPVRCKSGPRKGELTWTRPTLSTLSCVLHNPIYAGAYAYGRRPVDPKARYSGQKNRGKRWKPMAEWSVLLKDRLPAYISWERYQKNQERLRQNQRGEQTRGVPGPGPALLAGLIACGGCGRCLKVAYPHRKGPQYVCVKHLLEAREQTCFGLGSREIDDLVTQQVLRALEPAGIDLSLRALADAERERQRLDGHWQQQLQRARYDGELAERRYRAVDPDNRLVAASLERQWNEALQKERTLQEEYDRFSRQCPAQLTDEERRRIEALSSSIPALWRAPGTTNADRKQIIRCLVERVVVQVRPDSEYVNATIHWKGGYQSQHEFARSVRTYAQLRDFESLMARVAALRGQGHNAGEIAAALNAEGFRPPKCRGQFNPPMVYQLLRRRGLIGNERAHDSLRGANEWWLIDLAREVGVPADKLRDWAKRGWVHSRQTRVQKYWILWADRDEVNRLKTLLAKSQRGINAYETSLTKPKPKPKPKATKKP
jgi:DNA invertase Pin-like site-specific DNA recombinase